MCIYDDHVIIIQTMYEAEYLSASREFSHLPFVPCEMSSCEFWHQLKLLLWKNALIRFRNKKRLFIEFFWPLMIFLVLSWIRTRGLGIKRQDCHLVPKALPSVGGFEFIQNYVCTFINSCYDYDIEDEDHWKDSTVNKYSTPFEHMMEIFEKDPEGIYRDIVEEMIKYGVENTTKQFYRAKNVSKPKSPSNGFVVAEAEKIHNFLCGDPSPNLDDFLENSIDIEKLTDLNFLPQPPDRFIEKKNLSSFCRALFRRFYRQQGTYLVWRTLKHFIRGKILFAPKNPITEEIMRRVDEKIKEMNESAAVLASFRESLTSLRNWAIEHPEDMRQLKGVFSDEATVDRLLRKWGTEASELETMKDLIKRLIELDMEQDVDLIIKITEELGNFTTCIRYDKREGYDTEEEAVKAAEPLQPINQVWAVVIFEFEEGNASLPDLLTYKIRIAYLFRMDRTKVDKTYVSNDKIRTQKRPLIHPFDLKYITYGFAYLQEMTERAVIEMKTGISLEGQSLYLQQSPFPCYVDDVYLDVIALTFPLLMTLSWIYSAAMIIKSVVYEKEFYLKEMMKVMGLGNTVMWLGWFIDNFFVLCLSATILSAILKFGNLLHYSDFSLLWIFMISYAVSLICLSFLISTFFSRANSAAAAGGITFFLLYLPFHLVKFWIDRDVLTLYTILPCCLNSNIAFAIGCNAFVELERTGIGGTWDTFDEREDAFDLRYFIVMLWVDSCLYFVLTLYIEVVSPASGGIPKPWYFLLQPSTYRQKPVVIKHYSTGAPLHKDEHSKIEPVPEAYVSGVKVIRLGKTFSNGRIALKNLSIDFYENQITSFLGHNGAGKTTTVSILTGLYPPSEGTAYVNGYEITKDMNRARKTLGVCPQYNVVFNRLTIAEHLKFFSGMKGKENMVNEEEIGILLKDLGISEKRDDFPPNLSGGMKRKLCVGIAFCGGSKTVFLDEPTSGVDPYSRRSIWELLLKYKAGRTIILTTHFMDEADILGDRIAIISRGSLKAVGSSLFLKNSFGPGYSLHLVRKQREPERRSVSKSMVAEFEKSSLALFEQNRKKRFSGSTITLHRFLKTRIRSAKLTSHIGTEITYLLPYESSTRFSKLFNDLDDNLLRLGIISYGISDTSLEDVFLKVTLQDLERPDSDTRVKKKLCSCLTFKRKNKVQAHTTSSQDTDRSLKSNAAGAEEKTDGIKPQPSQDSPLASNPNDKTSNTTLTQKFVKASKSIGQKRTISDPSLPPPAMLPLDAASSDVTISTNISSANESVVNIHDREYKPRRSFIVAMVQIKAIIVKRFRSSRRSLKSLFFEIILPAVLIAITLFVTKYLPDSAVSPALEITPFMYPTPLHFFFSDMTGGSVNFSGIIKETTGRHGLGTECLKVNLHRDICQPDNYKASVVNKFHSTRSKFVNRRMGDCGCQSGYQECPMNVETRIPPYYEAHMQTRISDTSKYALPEWTVKTYAKYYRSRHGGLQFNIKPIYPVRPAYCAKLFSFAVNTLLNQTQTIDPNSSLANATKERMTTKIWYNKKFWTSNIAYMNAFHNMILRSLDSSQEEQKGIILYQHPLRLTVAQRNAESLKEALHSIVTIVCLVFVLSFVPASFTLYLLEEKSCGGKHLHLVSGVKPLTYWCANFIYDMVKYLIPVGICVAVHIAFDFKAFVSSRPIGAFVVLLILYGWGVIPMMYPACHMFSIPSTAFVALSCVNLFIGVVTTITQVITVQLSRFDKFLQDLSFALDDVFLIFPQYCLGRGLMEFLLVDIEKSLHFNIKKAEEVVNYFEWKRVGSYLFCLLIHGVVFFILNLVIDYGGWIYQKCCRPKQRLAQIDQEEDEDVRTEREWVMENSNDPDCVLVAKNLTKYYKGKKTPSVNGITFAMNSSECFGLLGINGAGKTTTFKMLTGDVRMSGGTARISGYETISQRDQARKHFGYCPQEDGLDLYLNSYEVLELFGNLRGLTSAATKQATNKLIGSLGLARHANKICKTYSGGNKRKLSTAAALIGDPDVIFLDEPTSGMDPGARRQLWKVILELVRMGKSVVLTSHSMEECEALCSRLGIMVNGKFVCIGSTQYLKNRFGTGYILTVRCLEDKQPEFFEMMESQMPYAHLHESYCAQLKYQIAQEDAKLSGIFEVMMHAKQIGMLEQYSISQTTLDDVILPSVYSHYY